MSLAEEVANRIALREALTKAKLPISNSGMDPEIWPPLFHQIDLQVGTKSQAAYFKEKPKDSCFRITDTTSPREDIIMKTGYSMQFFVTPEKYNALAQQFIGKNITD